MRSVCRSCGRTQFFNSGLRADMGFVGLVTGGAKSGKSQHAERQVLAVGGTPIYIATAQALDEEMAERIARHKADRRDVWVTREEPHALAEALYDTDGDGVRLVDCLTLWLSNRMLSDADLTAEVDVLMATLARQSSPVWLVTNEVGSGIVPAHALGRAFRDASGVMNQRVGALANRVDLVVCGQVMTIKDQADR